MSGLVNFTKRVFWNEARIINHQGPYTMAVEACHNSLYISLSLLCRPLHNNDMIDYEPGNQDEFSCPFIREISALSTVEHKLVSFAAVTASWTL